MSLALSDKIRVRGIALDDLLPENLRDVQIAEQVVHEAYGLVGEDMLEHRISGPYPKARAFLAYILKRCGHLSYPQIARLFGGNHTTYILARNRFRADLSILTRNPLVRRFDELSRETASADAANGD